MVLASYLLLAVTGVIWVRAQSASDAFFFTTYPGRTDEARRVEFSLITYPSSWVLRIEDDTLRAPNPVRAATLRRDLESESRFCHREFIGAPDQRPRVSRFSAQSSVNPDGFWLASNGNFYRMREIESWVEVPCWFLGLLFAFAPACALWAWGKSRLRPPHACPGCGYDLRATADPAGPRLATCPECGRPSAANEGV
jgi:hypothetical protein